MFSTVGKFYSFLEIGFWNMNGAFQQFGANKVSKLSDEEFLKTIYNLDIFALSETHTCPDQQLDLNDYTEFSSTRKKSNNFRYYGGLTVFIKKEIKPGIKILSLNNPDVIWIELEKNFFNLERDIFVAFVYIPPYNSPYLQNMGMNTSVIFKSLEQDVAKYSSQGNVFLIGEFNSYTNVINDDVEHDMAGNNFFQLPINYIEYTVLPHENMDSRTPIESGKILLELCRSASL